MSLPWYLWGAIPVLLFMFGWDCRAFYRNARHAEFRLSHVIILTTELFLAIWIAAHGVRS